MYWNQYEKLYNPLEHEIHVTSPSTRAYLFVVVVLWTVFDHVLKLYTNDERDRDVLHANKEIGVFRLNKLFLYFDF